MQADDETRHHHPAATQPVSSRLSRSSHQDRRATARPVKRLTALAHELAADALRSDAGKVAHEELHKVLDGARVRYADEIKREREAVLTVEGKTAKASLATNALTFDDFVEAADYAVIDDAYKRAARSITPDLARTYSEHLAHAAPPGNDFEDALIEAHTTVAAMGLVPEIRTDLELAAEKIANQWLSHHRVAVKSLSDDRREAYRQIREMSANPLDVDLARPSVWLQPSSIREADGTERAIPTFEKHMLCDNDLLFPEFFTSSWEEKVLAAELGRPDNVAWYRNPARATQDSLGIAYEDGGQYRVVRPDFIFFARSGGGSIFADIVDPHGHHLADALAKLKGLARYAETNGTHFRRIEAVTSIGSGYKALDLLEPNVRAAVLSATNAKALYESELSVDYLT